MVDDSGFSDAPQVIAASFEHFIHLPAFPFAPVTVAIANLRALLQEGGLLYVEVPDARRYAEQVNAPSQDFNCEHINHFSLQCLHNAFARHGSSRDGQPPNVPVIGGGVLVAGGPSAPQVREGNRSAHPTVQEVLSALRRRVAFGPSFGILAISYMASTFLPFRAGELVRSVFLGLRERIAIPGVVGTILLERLSERARSVLAASFIRTLRRGGS